MKGLKGIFIIIFVLIGFSHILSCKRREADITLHIGKTEGVVINREGADSRTQDISRIKTEIIKSIPPGSIVVDGDVNDWEAAEVVPFRELNWIDPRHPSIEPWRMRIKSVRIAHDAGNLYVLLKIQPGIKQRFDERQTSGHIGYIYLDADGSESTGARRHIIDEYAGWDYRIYLPTGFIGKIGAQQFKPTAEYHIERIKSFTEKKVEHGYTFSCDYEDVAGADKASYKNPDYISFKGDFLEMRFPFEVLRIDLPTDIRLIIEDLKALPNAEIQIHAYLSNQQSP